MSRGKNRFAARARYIEGWYELDTEKLLSSITDDFIFEDPAESVPVGKIALPGYVKRWERRSLAAGSNGTWSLSNEVRQDANGILTDWAWWELGGTDLRGSALVKTSEEGVFLERVTYFDGYRG